MSNIAIASYRFEVIYTFGENEILNLTNICGGITIFEDINNYCLTADLDIIDIMGLLKLIKPNFNPNNILTVKINNISYNFCIYDITNIAKNSFGTANNSYTIKLISPLFFKNTINRLYNHYDKPITKIIVDIFKQLNYPLKIYAHSSENFNYIVPNLRPFGVFDKLLKRAKSDKLNLPFFLTETLYKGAILDSYENAFKNKIKFFLTEMPTVAQGTMNEQININLQMQYLNALQVQQVDYFPVAQLASYGVYSNSAFNINYLEKTFNLKNYRAIDSFGTPLLNEDNQETLPKSNELLNNVNTNFYSIFTNGEDLNKDWINYYGNFNTHSNLLFNNERIRLRANGLCNEFGYSVGEKIYLNLSQQSSNSDDQFDKMRSGVYFILALKHSFDFANLAYHVTMECGRE